VETGRNEGAGARNDEGETKMATMKTTKITCILALVLGMASSASADEIVVSEWIGRPLDIPDNGEYATSYVVGDHVPRWARVTGVTYKVLVDDRGTPGDFWCSDYEIGLSSTVRGGTSNYLLVWDNAGSLALYGGTDADADDDSPDDSDIELSRSTEAFNRQPVHQTWYFSVKDNVGRHWSLETGLGCLKKVTLTIQYGADPDPVHFHDPNLKAAVEAQLGVTNPTAADMLLLTGLYADNKGICDLTVLEYATNLDKLWLDANKISDISPLAGLTNLRWLILILQSDQRHLPSGGIDEPEISHALSQSDQRHLPPGGTDEPDW